MRGGQVFMESLLLHGVDAIFGNPGTTENPLLDRLIDYPQLPYYVALHEGVAVCAASFHAQATGRTAVANLHVAPGLGNAIGMMYGALKAASPLIVIAIMPFIAKFGTIIGPSMDKIIAAGPALVLPITQQQLCVKLPMRLQSMSRVLHCSDS